MQLTLISGLSGSGKSVALKALEDAGWFAVDNLPADLIPGLLAFVAGRGEPRLAVSADARSADTIGVLPEVVLKERARGTDVRLLFLDATDESLVRRFGETRRPHPLATDGRTLEEAIAQERRLLADVADLGDRIDTSTLTPVQLRRWIQDLAAIDRSRLTLVIESFGFKGGVPLNADFVFDVRFLTNPHYDPKLRPLTGNDPEVVSFIESEAEAGLLIDDIERFLRRWLPKFALDRWAALTVAIGCTGGRHRSVHIANQLAERFAADYPVIKRHRDLDET